MGFFEIVGIGTTAIIFIVAIISVIDIGPIPGVSGPDGFIFTVFGFGFVTCVEGSLLQENLNGLRKTKGKTFFITAPRWFNKNVWNIGGSKLKPEDMES